jgi:hypothetical protein
LDPKRLQLQKGLSFFSITFPLFEIGFQEQRALLTKVHFIEFSRAITDGVHSRVQDLAVAFRRLDPKRRSWIVDKAKYKTERDNFVRDRSNALDEIKKNLGNIGPTPKAEDLQTVSGRYAKIRPGFIKPFDLEKLSVCDGELNSCYCRQEGRGMCW